jgi:hypothetical protein
MLSSEILGIAALFPNQHNPRVLRRVWFQLDG